MTTTLQQWGNSLALRLPKALTKQIHLKKGSRLDLTVKGNSIILVEDKRLIYTLNDLLKRFKPSQKHSELDFGPPQGQEVW